MLEGTKFVLKRRILWCPYCPLAPMSGEQECDVVSKCRSFAFSRSNNIWKIWLNNSA